MNLKNSIKNTKNNLIGRIGEWKAAEWLKSQGYEILPPIFRYTHARGLTEFYREDYKRLLDIMESLRGNGTDFYRPDLIIRKKGEKKIILVEVKASTKGQITFKQEQLTRFEWLDKTGFGKMLISVPVELEITWSVGEPRIIKDNESLNRARKR